MDGHFFVHAPILPWSQWIWRRLGFQSNQQPSLLTETTLSKTALPESPTGISPQRAKAECAIEYSTFLATHFYSAESPIQLLVPHKFLQDSLEKGSIIGVEIRTRDGSIAGIMFCLYSGLLKVQTVAESTGTITWHCVHPSWRKKGIPNALLRSIYIFTQPRNVYWFRNDGFLKPSVPPTWTEQRIQRKKGSIRVIGSVTKHPHYSKRVPHTKWQQQLKQSWLQQYPDGFLLDDLSFKYRLVEWWELTVRPGVYCIVVLQPTFEVQKNSKGPTATTESWCEVIAWYMTSQQITTYEFAQYIETTLDATPYTWFDAPNSMPHGETQWNQAGLSNWCAFGLDPGVPVQRPILSLCMA